MPVKIRAIELNDLNEISQMVRSLSYYYIKSYQHSPPAWFTQSLSNQAFIERFFSDEFAGCVYEKSGNIHGYLLFKKPNQIYHLFVAEAVHNRGVGSQLWAHTQETLALENQPIITLRSSLTAVPFYQKLGFAITGAIEEKEGICYQPMQLIQQQPPQSVSAINA